MDTSVRLFAFFFVDSSPCWVGDLEVCGVCVELRVEVLGDALVNS